jgi:hypothetical protein
MITWTRTLASTFTATAFHMEQKQKIDFAFSKVEEAHSNGVGRETRRRQLKKHSGVKGFTLLHKKEN